LQEAEAKFRHAIKLQTNSPVAQHLLGMTLEKEGDTEGAVAAYQKAVEMNPGDLSARQSVSRLKPSEAPVAQTSTSSDLAEGPIEGKTAEDDPAKVSEFENYIRESRYNEVEPSIASYVKEHPNSSWGWYALGYSQFAQKKIGDSIKSLAQSLALNARNADAHKILGRDLMVIGRFDAAQTEFEQAIRFAPKSSEGYYDLGKLYSIQDNWLAARKQFEEAIRLDPGYIEAIDSLGFAQEALSDDASALQTYRKAIALNEERHGKFVSAHVNLSAYYNRTGNTDLALQYAQRAIKLNAKTDLAYFQMAKAFRSRQEWTPAAEALRSAIAINSESPQYFYILSSVDSKLGNYKESQEAIKTFRELEAKMAARAKLRRDSLEGVFGSKDGASD